MSNCVLSVIVPCYNEEESIPLFYNEMSRVMMDYGLNEYEVLFVNDGSSDKTLEIIKELSVTDRHVSYASLSRNFGKEAAMYAGFCNTKGKYVAVMDADLQHPPALLPRMISILETGEYDSVATMRTDRKGEPPIRSWFARLFYKIINKCSDADIVDGAGDYRLMTREMADAVVAMSEHNRFSKGIFGWVGFRTYWMPHENVERAAGESKWSFWKLMRYAIDGIISFSETPLRIASYMGIMITTVSLFALVFVVVRKILFGDPVAGWASLTCFILFMGGVQLAVLGIIGEYLAKTFVETKDRPHYIISESNLTDAVRIK